MLTSKQISEIREHLDKAQNPVFFFDNDVDGLISFILLRRSIGKGKGVAIKSFPELDESYLRRIDEFNSDYVFILDKPIVSGKFIEESRKKGIPIVWIDHHDVPAPKKYDNLSYYNSLVKGKGGEPTSYLAHKIANKKQDYWLSLIGSIADNYVPEFYQDFVKDYPELSRRKTDSAFEILYETDIGKLVLMLSFGLKDRTSNVMAMINFLFDVKSPIELLKEDSHNSSIFSRYDQINKIYVKLLEKAKKVARGGKKVIFFQYGGEMSLSADIANELSYRFPGKIIMVAFVKGLNANVSIRGALDVRKVTLEAIDDIESASGGGHKNATGAKMSVEDLPRFKQFFEKAFN